MNRNTAARQRNRDIRDLSLNLVKEAKRGLRIVSTPVSQGLGHNQSRSIGADMDFFPARLPRPPCLAAARWLR